MRRLAIPLFALAVLLIGCDQEAMFQKMVPQEEAALAKGLVARLASKDFAAVEARLPNSLRTPEARGQLEQMASLLSPESPKSIRVVGSNSTSKTDATTYNLTFEYEYPDRWLIVNTALERRDGVITLDGIQVTPTPQSLETINRFTFDGKGVLQYVVFALAVVIPILVVYTLAVCARTKVPKRKRLWFLFIAVGVVQFKLNWTNGAWAVQPIAFSLLGSGFEKMGPVAPYVFTIAFPLGAIVFLVKRRAMLMRNDA
jgi:hypothetical protein